MSEKAIKEAIGTGTLKCPECGKSIKRYEKYAETIDAVREGFNVLDMDSRGARVTLVCANDGCAWKERTEYWDSFVQE